MPPDLSEIGALPDALPFYLALEPSPCDDRIAFAVIRMDPVSRDFVVSVIVEDRSVALEVFRFSRLAPVHFAWSPSGRDLAFAQGATMLLRTDAGTLRPISLLGNVQWLGFDQEHRLWRLAADALVTQKEHAIGGVDAVTSGARIVFARRELDSTCLYQIDAGAPSLLARIPGGHATIKLSSRGDYLVAVLAAAAQQQQVAAKLLRIHIPSGKVETLLDRTLSCGFNAGPGLDASVSESGEVFAAFEDGECTLLWQLAPGTAPRAISPPGFEVFDFSLHPNDHAVAVIASDTHRALGVFESALLLGQRTATGWKFEPAVEGVHDMPRWRADGSVEVLCGTTGRWHHATYTRDVPFAPTPMPCLAMSLTGATELDLLRLSGPDHRNFVIVLLPRLHQRYVAGAQPLFFHHMLFSIARGLAADGYTVVTVSGPGAIGRGRPRREFTGGYLPTLTATMRELVTFLMKTGCRSFALMAGSLAAVPGLRLLGDNSPLSAACFVAPLLEASIPVTEPVRDLLLDDPLFPTLDAAAANLLVPTHIVYAATDDVAPSSQVDRLMQQTERARVTCHVLANERHIFSRMSSWRETQASISSFLAALVPLERPDQADSLGRE